LIIYNLLGQKIRTLVNTEISAGKHESQWDGKDDNNKPMGSGIYLYQLISGSNVIDTKKMTLLK
jgi:flagellar hook assembly protein FlgD